MESWDETDTTINGCSGQIINNYRYEGRYLGLYFTENGQGPVVLTIEDEHGIMCFNDDAVEKEKSPHGRAQIAMSMKAWDDVWSEVKGRCGDNAEHVYAMLGTLIIEANKDGKSGITATVRYSGNASHTVH